MRIIARRTLRQFHDKYPDSKGPLDSWYHEVKKIKWFKPQDIKNKYKNASIVANNRVVFNIGGNKYRLVVKVDYKASIVLIRFVGTHKEYDKIKAGEI